MNGYIHDWTRWNEVRTIVSLMSFLLFGVAAGMRLWTLRSGSIAGSASVSAAVRDA